MAAAVATVGHRWMNASGGGDAGCHTALASVCLEYKKAHGYVVVGVCVLGILANLANIIVLTRKKMRSAVNALLTALAVAELSLMCAFLPIGGYYYAVGGRQYPTMTFFWKEPHSLYYALFFTTFSVMCHAAAVWLTIAVAAFRYVRLRFPMRGRQWCTTRNANVATCVVVAAAAALAAPNWVVNGITLADAVDLTRFPYCVQQPPATAAAAAADGDASPSSPSSLIAAGLYTIDSSEFAREHKLIVVVNYYLQSVFVRLLPTILLVTLTVLLVCIMRSAELRRRQLLSGSKAAAMAMERGGGGGGDVATPPPRGTAEHNRTTRMLLAAVALVLAVEVPHGVFIIFMLVDPSYKNTYDTLGDLIDMATLLSQSLNFFLYTAMSTQFRHTFFSLFCRKWAERVEHEWTQLTAGGARRGSTRGSQRSLDASATAGYRPSVDAAAAAAKRAGSPRVDASADGATLLLLSVPRRCAGGSRGFGDGDGRGSLTSAGATAAALETYP